MRRLAILSVILFLLIIIAGLSQTAMDPDNFTGKWYSSKDQSIYLFQEGLIYSPKHAVALSDKDSISGAYSFCGTSVFLFAKGIDGLETEQELYLVTNHDGCFLCENTDGSGTVYFIRYDQ